MEASGINSIDVAHYVLKILDKQDIGISGFELYSLMFVLQSEYLYRTLGEQLCFDDEILAMDWGCKVTLLERALYPLSFGIYLPDRAFDRYDPLSIGSRRKDVVDYVAAWYKTIVLKGDSTYTFRELVKQSKAFNLGRMGYDKRIGQWAIRNYRAEFHQTLVNNGFTKDWA